MYEMTFYTALKNESVATSLVSNLGNQLFLAHDIKKLFK